jgi:hypothetical protein
LELSFSDCNVKNENYATELYSNSGIIAKNLLLALRFLAVIFTVAFHCAAMLNVRCGPGEGPAARQRCENLVWYKISTGICWVNGKFS